MREWLKLLLYSICIITLLLHLLPDGKFVKYVRFYAGLLFFLIALEPLLGLFLGNGELTKLLQLRFRYGRRARRTEKCQDPGGVPKRDQSSDWRNRRILYRKRGECQDYILGRRIYAGKCRDPSVRLRVFAIFSGRCNIF